MAGKYPFRQFQNELMIADLSPQALIDFLSSSSDEKVEGLFASGELKFSELHRLVVFYFVTKRTQLFSIPYLSKHCGIADSTLYDWSSRKTCTFTRRALTPDEDLALLNWIDCYSQRGFRVSRYLILDKAKKLCPNPEFKASIKWFRNFKRNHPELVRKRREYLGKLRARSCSKETVEAYFQLVETFANGSDVLFANLDETGIDVSSHGVETFALRGKRHSPPAVCQEKGAHITVVGVILSNQTSLPPFYIFTGKRPPKLDVPLAVSESGWMNDTILEKYLDFLLSYLPSRRPLVLIWDGLMSHTQNVNVLERLVENNIVVISLAPHSSHLTQPLDRTVYGPLKTQFSANLDTWNAEHPNCTLKKSELISLFSDAWNAALTPKNIESAFKFTGLKPFNPAIVLEKFSSNNPNSTFERTLKDPANMIIDDDLSSESESDSDHTTLNDLKTRLEAAEKENLRLQAELNARKRVGRPSKRRTRQKRLKSTLHLSPDPVPVRQPPETLPGCQSSDAFPVCRSPEAGSILSLPMPVAQPTKQRRGRRCHPAAVLTDPHYIAALKSASKTKKKKR